jgi:hypothetical protein
VVARHISTSLHQHHHISTSPHRHIATSPHRHILYIATSFTSPHAVFV